MTDHKTAAGDDAYYAPPPSGPPPGHNGLPQESTSASTQPSYSIPTYDPAHPSFAPPPTDSKDEKAAYNTSASPATNAGTTAQDAPAKKSGWGDKLSSLGSKAAVPFNMVAGKLGAESFLPTTMDKECEKAARILRSFCKDGIYTDPDAAAPFIDTVDGKTGTDKKEKVKPKSRTLLTIPSKVINRAAGLAIFTTARAGFHLSGSTGSGVLIARLPDGSWSPPSGIQIHSVGAGFVIGLDIYDCVVVINTKEALQAFTRTRMSLGSDLAVVAGPWGAGGSVDFAAPSSSGKDAAKSKDATAQSTTGASTGPVPTISEPEKRPITPDSKDKKDRKPSPFRKAITSPVYSYVKSRGFYAGVQVDGTVVTERKDANAAFYGATVPVENIMLGRVPAPGPSSKWPVAAKALFDVVRGAEGWHGQGNNAATISGGGNVPLSPYPSTTGHMDVGGQQHSMSGATMTEEEIARQRQHQFDGSASTAGAAAAAPSYVEHSPGEMPEGEYPPAYALDGTAVTGVQDEKAGQHYG